MTAPATGLSSTRWPWSFDARPTSPSSTATWPPPAQDAHVTVNRALDGEGGLGDDLAPALRHLTDAARSLNARADCGQRHPEALLRGKQGPDAK